MVSVAATRIRSTISLIESMETMASEISRTARRYERRSRSNQSSTKPWSRSRSGLSARIARNKNTTENHGERALMLTRAKAASALVMSRAKSPVTRMVAKP
jgi:hypothetical protein